MEIELQKETIKNQEQEIAALNIILHGNELSEETNKKQFINFKRGKKI